MKNGQFCIIMQIAMKNANKLVHRQAAAHSVSVKVLAKVLARHQIELRLLRCAAHNLIKPARSKVETFMY